MGGVQSRQPQPEGLSDYTGFAGYVAATQRMTLTVIGAPALGQGVGVYAGTPANLDNSGSNLTIVYDGVDYEVYDVTLSAREARRLERQPSL